jgi:HlyD family secretion protein
MDYACVLRRSAALAALAFLMGCKEEVEPPVYQLVQVATRDITVSVTAEGAVEPIKTIDVKSKASGEIVDVLAETGDIANRGDLLVSVDPRIPQNGVVQAEAELNVARAQLANAQSQLDRAEALFASQSITEQEYENANLQRANANAQLVRAQRSLEDARITFQDTEVRAPASGVILQRAVEVGTVISSATREVGGGAVLMRMANLDTIQVRTMVDETDIGKVNPGLDVTITVDAYPNRPFTGSVLKIEPQATEAQNVTMFPVLMRIPNESGLLRPGMNADVEIHVGFRDGIMAIPNAALRTERDLASAASVLGIDMEVVQQQLAAAREAPGAERTTSLGGATAHQGGQNTVEMRGQTIELPEGVTRDQVQPILEKMTGGGFQSMTDEERSILQRVMRAAGGGARGGMPGGGGGRRRPQSTNFQFGGNFIVFILTETGPQARPIRTGLTDLDYSQVESGLNPGDLVMILPSASLVDAQREFQERMNRMTGGGLPGLGGRGRR